MVNKEVFFLIFIASRSAPRSLWSPLLVLDSLDKYCSPIFPLSKKHSTHPDQGSGSYFVARREVKVRKTIQRTCQSRWCTVTAKIDAKVSVRRSNPCCRYLDIDCHVQQQPYKWHRGRVHQITIITSVEIILTIPVVIQWALISHWDPTAKTRTTQSLVWVSSRVRISARVPPYSWGSVSQSPFGLAAINRRPLEEFGPYQYRLGPLVSPCTNCLQQIN